LFSILPRVAENSVQTYNVQPLRKVSRVTAWPAPVERVAAFLRAAGAEARLEEFGVETATAADAARAVGCDPAEIVKSLVVIADGKAVVALVPGDRRGDTEKIARVVGATRVRIARGDEVRMLTDFDPGAVAPFPLPRVQEILVDSALLARRAVWIGAGSERHLAVLPTPELVRLTKARAADITLET
jgi:prolyl-tRNA editing enzyme YbaK/EbsC (Cys-tRNA(Pro) deacylase)